MRCPFCSKNNDRVVDSRESRDGETIRRRRECLECRRRFTSYEQIEDIPYMVVKSDGRRELWNRSKLMSGLHKACEKRPIPTSVLEDLVEVIERAVNWVTRAARQPFQVSIDLPPRLPMSRRASAAY